MKKSTPSVARRRRPFALATVALALALPVVAAAVMAAASPAALPANGSVSPTATEASWSGGPFLVSNPGSCLTTLDCDRYILTIQPPATGTWSVDIAITPQYPRDDYDLYVYGPNGKRVASSASSGGHEKVTLEEPVAGDYRVVVQPWLVTPGSTYEGKATMSMLGTITSDEKNSVLYPYDPKVPQAAVDVPLRVVFVGFEPAEVDAAKVLAEIPNYQRPGVLIPRGNDTSGDTTQVFGGDTLINHGRRYYESTRPFLVPYEYRWKPEIHFAPATFTAGLFTSMMANSTTGDFATKRNRDYLETYNTERGVYRGLDRLVPAGAPVRFVDGESVEDWIAQNAEAQLGFDVGPKAGKHPGPGEHPGYTVFVLNTWDSPEAKTTFPLNEYHAFKINRTDPDTGTFDGIDWARVWGGRYRFLMLDAGAAPNPYEAETWGNRNRSLHGSVNYDPPLWEYRANAPRPTTLVSLSDGWTQAVTPGETFDLEYFNFMLGRTVNQAASFRFLHSYLYEPWPGTGQFYLSDNVWHDKHAEIPWPSDLTKLYDQATVLRGLSTLTPYFNFNGDVKFEYLTEASPEHDADQAMIDQAKADGDDIAHTPFTAMNTTTAMNYFDANPRLSARGAPCYTSVPGLSVVVEKHYAWALPVIVAGIAPNRGGVPFGYLNSVSDITKSSHADRDPAVEAIHPQAFSGAFTYTAVHEASHYLGLAHPHDSLGASRNADGTPRYYDGFTWTYNSTAAPTTYSHTELVYNVLDQESIARGHTAYYLKWADLALAEGGEAFYNQGLTTLKQLSREARALRKAALDHIEKAEKYFAAFDFVSAAFAGQEAWRNAAAYRDLALGLPAGTSELEKGTKLEGAESCPSATR